MRRAGDTALHHAVKLMDQPTRQAVLRVLLSQQLMGRPGPNVEAANNAGHTPLMLAIIEHDHGDACNMLMQQQQNLNLADKRGYTALHHAGARSTLSRALFCGCRAGWVPALYFVQQARRSCLQQHRRSSPVHSARPLPGR